MKLFSWKCETFDSRKIETLCIVARIVALQKKEGFDFFDMEPDFYHKLPTILKELADQCRRWRHTEKYCQK